MSKNSIKLRNYANERWKDFESGELLDDLKNVITQKIAQVPLSSAKKENKIVDASFDRVNFGAF